MGKLKLTEGEIVNQINFSLR